MHFILSLASDAQRYLDHSKMFSTNSLIIAYRCAPNQFDSNENSAAAAAQPSASSETGQVTASDFNKAYGHFSIYTNQVYYLSRNAVSSQTD